jgi:uncharacterized protein
MSTTVSRLHVVDALRGFAIISIMLLHNIEHFDFYFTPVGLPDWIVKIDKTIWDSLFFLFGGKAYAIFALLFGLTFLIQSDNQKKKGNDFRLRFAWRMLLLLLFGLINSAFYEGDILTIYAVIGLFLIPVANLRSSVVFLIAVLLMLQPYEWVNVFIGLQNPDMKMADPVSWSYFGRAGEYITGDSIVKTWIGNLTNGKIAVLNWTWENGRVFQTLSLFLFGMLAGRKSLFDSTVKNKKFWRNTLLIAAIAFIPLFMLNGSLGKLIESESIRRPMSTIISSWSNMAFMLVLVSGFTLLFQTRFFGKVLNVFSYPGRMSLSNYMIQSIVGAFIYYGFGLGLYKYTGATYCLIIGILLATLQTYFSYWWMSRRRQGPLETVWHKLTWLGTKN